LHELSATISQKPADHDIVPCQRLRWMFQRVERHELLLVQVATSSIRLRNMNLWAALTSGFLAVVWLGASLRLREKMRRLSKLTITIASFSFFAFLSN
jgi:hypothetical protein